MQKPETKTYTVLRAICMQGERVEVGEPVELTAGQYAELANAGKVGPFDPKAKKARGKAAAKPAEPAAELPQEPAAAEPVVDTGSDSAQPSEDPQ